MTAVVGPFLDFDPEAGEWLIGPTDERPLDQWLPGAVEAVIKDLGLAGRERPREIVRTVLNDTAARHPSPLAYFVTRWTDPAELPLTLFFGMVERSADDLDEIWLLDADRSVEKPIVERVEAAEGVQIRRSAVYSADDASDLVVGLRYVVDSGHPQAVVLAHTAGYSAAEMLAAREPIEAFLRTMRVLDSPPGNDR
jgi:hypothetical protein